MKILVKETKEVEVEVTFPAYFVYCPKYSNGSLYYKALSADGAVTVVADKDRAALSIDPIYSSGIVSKLFTSNDYVQCTEQEFNLAYSKALQALMEYATSFPVENTVTISEQHAA